MKKFEDKKYTGPLGEFLENCKPHRIEAIYNTKYTYVKEIIYDTELQELYGDSRDGYDKFKNRKLDTTTATDISHGGVLDLRILTQDGKESGAVIETKRTSNDNYNQMFIQYQLAKLKLLEILEIKDSGSFLYWYEENYSGFNFSRGGANETITAIERLENIIIKYNNEEEFKEFIDKIKQ
jgi:hypothetical protein